ncbi:MAG: hypothetical protein ABW148_16065 [Sedimenticola sp.]
MFHRGQAEVLLRLRKVARDAMKSLAIFQPQLTGSVLNGTADSHSCITLVLFAETTEEVILRLLELKIPWREEAPMLRYCNGSTQRRPLLSFVAGETAIELLILTPGERRNPPLDPADGRPLKGAGLSRLDQLMVRD